MTSRDKIKRPSLNIQFNANSDANNNIKIQSKAYIKTIDKAIKRGDYEIVF